MKIVREERELVVDLPAQGIGTSDNRPALQILSAGRFEMEA